MELCVFAVCGGMSKMQDTGRIHRIHVRGDAGVYCVHVCAAYAICVCLLCVVTCLTFGTLAAYITFTFAVTQVCGCARCTRRVCARARVAAGLSLNASDLACFLHTNVAHQRPNGR